MTNLVVVVQIWEVREIANSYSLFISALWVLCWKKLWIVWSSTVSSRLVTAGITSWIEAIVWAMSMLLWWESSAAHVTQLLVVMLVFTCDTMLVQVLAVVCLSHAGIVSKRLHRLSWFLCTDFPRPMLCCILGKLGYLQKYGYFSLELWPKLWT